MNGYLVVGGFPSGQYHLQSRLLEIELAVKDGADELDTVINRAAALDSDWNSTLFNRYILHTKKAIK